METIDGLALHVQRVPRRALSAPVCGVGSVPAVDLVRVVDAIGHFDPTLHTSEQVEQTNVDSCCLVGSDVPQDPADPEVPGAVELTISPIARLDRFLTGGSVKSQHARLSPEGSGGIGVGVPVRHNEAAARERRRECCAGAHSGDAAND